MKAPFPMGSIKEFIFPRNDFSIIAYGAIAGDSVNNTTALPMLSKLVTKLVVGV